MDEINTTERISKMEQTIALNAQKQDMAMEILKDMQQTMKAMQEILTRFVVVEERHTTLEEEVRDLKKDYSDSKSVIISSIGMWKGIVFAGAMFVSTIVGLGGFVFHDKLGMLESHETRITSVEKEVSLIETKK